MLQDEIKLIGEPIGDAEVRGRRSRVPDDTDTATKPLGLVPFKRTQVRKTYNKTQ